MIEVIEHLEDPIKTLRTLRTVLKPDGMIFLSTPAGKHRENLTTAYDTPSHLHFFTPLSLNLALTVSGYTKIDYSYYPEMYPLPPKKIIGPHILNSAKTVLKPFLVKMNLATERPPDHLVGFTKPKAS